MKWGAAAAIVAATVLDAGPVLAQASFAGLPRAHHSLGIPGSLDPNTGKFTPDSTSETFEPVRGTLNFVYNLDAADVSSTSVQCATIIVYSNIFADLTEFSGNNNVSNFYLDYNQKNNNFVGSSPVDFAVVKASDSVLVADIDITCRYTFDPKTQIYMEHVEARLHSGANFVAVGGVLDGLSF